MNYDVIIVGSGVAGCYAALNLDSTKKILLITKRDLEESDSFLAQGGICVLQSESDYDSYFEDTMHAGHYENNRESVEIMIRSSAEVIRSLQVYGVEFANENGKLLYTREGAHSHKRILYHDDETGKEITKNLLAAVQKKKNVEIRTFTVMRDILVHGGKCEGILMEDADGALFAVYARDVIWATGGIGGIYENSTNFAHLMGDALAIALRHHIELENPSYIQIHPTTLFQKSKGRRFLVSESVRGEGAKLYNKKGERFTDELKPRDVVSAAIFDEMEKEGSEHVWLSLMDIKGMDVTKRFPSIYKKCMEEGYDITKQMIPVVPAQHYFMGGVKVGSDSQTTLLHLYAAGEASCNGVHGANRLASNSLLESLVFAKRAAKRIMQTQEERKVAVSVTDKQLTDPLYLKERYHIDLNKYADIRKLEKENEHLIKAAIEEDRREKNGSNHEEAEC